MAVSASRRAVASRIQPRGEGLALYEGSAQVAGDLTGGTATVSVLIPDDPDSLWIPLIIDVSMAGATSTRVYATGQMPDISNIATDLSSVHTTDAIGKLPGQAQFELPRTFTPLVYIPSTAADLTGIQAEQANANGITYRISCKFLRFDLSKGVRLSLPEFIRLLAGR